MTYQKTLDLGEIEAQLALERYLDAFEANDHPEILNRLNIEVEIAQQRYGVLTRQHPVH